jgi:hypothetical protein
VNKLSAVVDGDIGRERSNSAGDSVDNTAFGTYSEWTGACHCGAIGFHYHTQIEPASWSVRACQCSFCRKHQALTTSDPKGHVRLVENGPSAPNRYRFGQQSADFLVCRHCGVYIAAVMESTRGRFAIINIRALQTIPPGLKVPEPMNYETEDMAQRAARRERVWTPVG